MQVISRDQWNARPSSRPLSWAPLDRGIVFHWNGPALGNYSRAGSFQIVRNTQNFHIDGRGWSDIAYNYAISRFGDVFEGRGDLAWNAASGHNEANQRYMAVEFILGEGEPFGDEMKQAAVDFVAWYKATKRPANLTVHFEWASTACPGSEIANFVHNQLLTFVPQSKPEPEIVPVPPPNVPEPIKPRFLLQQGLNMYIHHPTMRSMTFDGKFVYDFTYVPRNGAWLGQNATKSVALCIRHDTMRGGDDVTLFHGNGSTVEQVTLKQGTNTIFVKADGAFSVVAESGDLVCQIREETIYNY